MIARPADAGGSEIHPGECDREAAQPTVARRHLEARGGILDSPRFGRHAAPSTGAQSELLNSGELLMGWVTLAPPQVHETVDWLLLEMLQSKDIGPVVRALRESHPLLKEATR